MTTSFNYVDLYDRLYPHQHLPGFTDDSQIDVEEFNRRFAVIRANERATQSALNNIWNFLPDGSRFTDFIRPFSEVAASRLWVLSPQEHAAATWLRGFDAAGDGLDFPEERIVFHMNDIGTVTDESQVAILFFVNGELVGPTAYTITHVQGGFSLYAKKALNMVNTPVRVVILRKFGERGITHDEPPVLFAEGNGNSVDGHRVIMPRLVDIGPIYDIRYYRLFRRAPSDQYFRIVPEDKVVARTSANDESALFTVFDDVVDDTEFVVVNIATHWKKEIDAITTHEDGLYRVPLVYSDRMPVPVSRIEDIDIWCDGRRLRANSDYWLEWNNGYIRSAPQIIFKGMPCGFRHLLVMANAPYDPELNLHIVEDTISNPSAIYSLPREDHPLRLVEDIGITFTGGYLDSVNDGSTVIAENIGIHLKHLSDTKNLEFRIRAVFPPALLKAAIQESAGTTPLERFVDMMKPANGFGVDFVAKYRVEHPEHVQPALYRPETRPLLFGAGFYWALDEVEQSRARDTNATISTYPNEVGILDPWRQDNLVLFDCREQINYDVDARPGKSAPSLLYAFDAREGQSNASESIRIADMRSDAPIDGNWPPEEFHVHAVNPTLDFRDTQELS